MTIFENKGLRYGYDFDCLCLEQAEICNEISTFKAEQLKSRPKDILELTRSGGAEWLLKASSWLLTEVDINNVPLPWSVTMQAKAEGFVRSLPVKYHKDIKAVMDDFFTHIESEWKSSALLQNEEKNGLNLETLSMLMSMIKPNVNEQKS